MSARISSLLALAAALAGAHSAATAQELVDPTRPPASLMAAPAAASPAASTAPRVQSILIARQPGGRHIAIIDGQTVRLGDTFRGARLARMTETEVVLVQGARTQVLKLFPATAPNAASLQR